MTQLYSNQLHNSSSSLSSSELFKGKFYFIYNKGGKILVIFKRFFKLALIVTQSAHRTQEEEENETILDCTVQNYHLYVPNQNGLS